MGRSKRGHKDYMRDSYTTQQLLLIHLQEQVIRQRHKSVNPHIHTAELSSSLSQSDSNYGYTTEADQVSSHQDLPSLQVADWSHRHRLHPICPLLYLSYNSIWGRLWEFLGQIIPSLLVLGLGNSFVCECNYRSNTHTY